MWKGFEGERKGEIIMMMPMISMSSRLLPVVEEEVRGKEFAEMMMMMILI